MSNAAPHISTHIPLTVSELPPEPTELAVGRADLPTPSLWQANVLVTHKQTGRRAAVLRVDYGTNMFRAFYPDEGDPDPVSGKPVGRFGTRTEWEHCREWNVEVTFSPKELERQAALDKLNAEIDHIGKTSPEAFAWIKLLCDDADPTKSLAKLEAMRAAGIIKVAKSEPAKDEKKK